MRSSAGIRKTAWRVAHEACAALPSFPWDDRHNPSAEGKVYQLSEFRIACPHHLPVIVEAEWLTHWIINVI